jgi:hypothetical protein
LVIFDRGDYCPKGGYDAVKPRGLPALLDDGVHQGVFPAATSCSSATFARKLGSKALERPIPYRVR